MMVSHVVSFGISNEQQYHGSRSVISKLNHRPLIAQQRIHNGCMFGVYNNGEKNDVSMMMSRTNNNPVYEMLTSPNDPIIERSNMNFYKDEAISHLHGYMLLVGLFGAHDELFLVTFLGLAGGAAAGTLAGALPANPRVPGMVAVLTFFATTIIRYGLGYEPMWFASSPLQYTGPADYAFILEATICALNAIWGLFLWQSWQTRENQESPNQ
jgi:hypothetical protein